MQAPSRPIPDGTVRPSLEGIENIEELEAPTRLLQIADGAAAAIGDPHLGIFVTDGVVRSDVFRSDHAGHQKFPKFVVDADFLATVDHHGAVRQNLRDDGGEG